MFALTSAGLACGVEAAPQIELTHATPLILSAAEDLANDLLIVVRYQDDNGNLGRGQASVFDCRSERATLRLEIPSIANAEAVADGIPIEGSLELVVRDVAVIAQETMPAACVQERASPHAFCVQVFDQSGLPSAVVCTPEIRIE